MVTGPTARNAFKLDNEDPRMRDKYGRHTSGQSMLLARRLVEAGCRFVTLDLSYHTASGTWDTHGDNIPPYGGISKGLKPLLPLFDHLVTTLVDDLADRGLLDDVLVLAQGEFGRTPKVGTQGSTDGRDHWPYCYTGVVAGGGMRRGYVHGKSDDTGSAPVENPVHPGELLASIYHAVGLFPRRTVYNHLNQPREMVKNDAVSTWCCMGLYRPGHL